jgi:hypothetical protein
MHQANSLSSNERAGLELALSRMTLNAFGSLATLPLFCLRVVNPPDVRSVIEERHDVWHSFLVVAREILRCGPKTLAGATPSVQTLFRAASDIRDAYVELAEHENCSPGQPMASYHKLANAFNQIRLCVEELKRLLAPEVDLSPLSVRLMERRTYDERNLRWFGKEVQTRSAKELGTATANSDVVE